MQRLERDEIEEPIEPPRHPPLVRPWRRFLARSFDYFLIATPLFIFLNFFLPDWRQAMVLHLLWMGALIPLLAIPIEAWCMTRWGATLGKALLRVTILGPHQRKLSFRKVWKRAVYVWIEGMGLGLPGICQLVQIYSYFALKAHFTTYWDRELHLHVTYERIGSPRLILFVFFLFLLDAIGVDFTGQLSQLFFLMEEITLNWRSGP